MNTTELKALLKKLHSQLNILQERAAKFGDNAPLELVNQIDDHRAAIGLVESRLAGQIDDKTLTEQLAPLALSLDRGQAEVVIGKNIIKIGQVVVPTLPLLALLAVVVGALAFVGWNLLGPSQMPLNTFNVAVAEFGQINAQGHISSSPDGQQLSEWMFRELQSEYKTWPTRQPVVWHDSMSIFQKRATIGLINGDTPAARLQAAQAVAQRLGASMVIYGNIAVDENPPRFVPEFYIAKIRNEADEVVGAHQLGAPIEVQLPLNLYDEQANAFFEGKLGARVDALVWFTRGLALDLSGRHDDALAVFKQAEQELHWENDQGREILYYFIGREALYLSRNDATYLDEAEKAFKTSLEINPSYTRAYIGLGGVYFQRAQQVPPQELLQNQSLNLALEAYQHTVEGGNNSPDDQTELKGLLALGKTYRLLGQAYLFSQNYDQAVPAYDQAIAYIQKAINLLAPDQHRLLAEAFLSLGAAYQGQAHSRLAGGDKPGSKTLFQQAKSSYDRCVTEADAEFYDSTAQDIKSKYCGPYSAEVQKVLTDLK